MEPKDSEYYMGNRDELPTILQVKTGHGVITQELPWDAGADELCQAFYTALVGMTFVPEGILQAMEDFVNERKPIDEGNYGEIPFTHKFNVGDKVKIINGPFSENTNDGKILDVVYADQYKVLYKVSFMMLEKNKTAEDENIHEIFMIEIINENDLKLDI